MKRMYWIGLAALVLWIGPPAPAAGPAEDAASALAQIPAKAPIVVQLRGVEQTKDRLVAMIKEALPDLGGKAEDHINEQLKKMLEGRSLKGVVKNGPVFVVLSDLPKDKEASDVDQKTAILIHVTKYTEFRD